MIKYILAIMLFATPAYATYYTSQPETPAPSQPDRSVESWTSNQCDRHNAVPCKANGAGNGVLFQDKRSKGIRP